MLHHSLYRRDLLRAMNAHPQIVRRRDPHRNVSRREGVAAGAGQIELSGAWKIQAARDHPAERLVAKDAADFLPRMGVKTDDAAEAHVLLEIGSCAAGFRTVVDQGRVEVHAADESSLWAGWVALEHEMCRAGGAILALGEEHREPAWPIQIAPPTWGSNYAVPDFSPEYLSDETFRSLAHQGVNGMLIYGDLLVYASKTKLSELHHPDAEKHLAILNQASERAAPYGIRFYYCVVGPKLPAEHALFERLPETRGAALAWGQHKLHCLCSSSKAALEFHADALANVFAHAPQLGGLILIIGGESYYHCFMRAADSAIGETNCPRCKGKVAEDVIANLLKVTADAVHRQSPNAAVVAWPYSAQFFWSKDLIESAMIERLPAGVGFLSEIDKDETLQKEGYQKHIWDYSVETEGASNRIREQTRRTRQRPREMFVKCETCHGIELLHMPYVPGITRSARMWESMRELAPKGVLQRWGFIGMFDSVAERTAFKARWNGKFDPEQAAMEVAREFVGDLAPQMVKAWQKFDQSLGHIPIMATGGYYIGPAFLGPCHPLPVWEGSMPDAFRGNLYYIAEAESTFSRQRVVAKDDLTLHSLARLGVGADGPSIDIVEREFATAAQLAGEGHAILDKHDATQSVELQEQQAIGELLYRTFVATLNTIKFLREREGKNAIDRLRSIAAEELENALAAEKMYEAAPWLNHALRLDLMCPESLAMVREKIQLLKDYLA